MLNLEGPAWQFALDFYGRPGVAPACLTLQDQLGLDVVHLVLLLYAYTVIDQPVSVEGIQEMRGAMAPWRGATVLPLRKIRVDLKKLSTTFPEVQEAVRTRIKDVELLAEQVQVAYASQWLHSQPTTPGLPLDSALQALVTVYDERGGRDPDQVKAALRLIADTARRMQGRSDPQS